MMAYRVTTAFGTVTIGLPVERVDARTELTFEGPADAIALVKDLLASSAGCFGHRLSTMTTPRDLAWCLAQTELSFLQPECLTGSELLRGPHPPGQ